MDYMEFSGKTVEDALTDALVSMGLTSDQIEYEVIEKGGSGLFSFKKQAKIRVRKKVQPDVEEPSAEEAAPADAEEQTTEAVEAVEEASAEEAVEEASEAVTEEMIRNKKDSVSDFLGQVFHAMNMDVDLIFSSLKERTKQLNELSMLYETSVSMFSAKNYLQEFFDFYEIKTRDLKLVESPDSFRGTLCEVSGSDVWQPIAEKAEELFGVPSRVMVFEDDTSLRDELEGPHGLGPFFFIFDIMFCEYEYYTLCFISGSNN
jgi:hypothetical protein